MAASKAEEGRGLKIFSRRIRLAGIIAVVACRTLHELGRASILSWGNPGRIGSDLNGGTLLTDFDFLCVFSLVGYSARRFVAGDLFSVRMHRSKGSACELPRLW